MAKLVLQAPESCKSVSHENSALLCDSIITCASGAVIPSIEMAAAGLDSIGAIVGFAVSSGIAIPSGSIIYSILSGPLQVCALCLFPGFEAPIL